MVTGPDDNVAEYYQQQVEMLEGFNEMDALAERGFIPGMSKVSIAICFFIFISACTNSSVGNFMIAGGA